MEMALWWAHLVQSFYLVPTFGCKSELRFVFAWKGISYSFLRDSEALPAGLAVAAELLECRKRCAYIGRAGEKLAALILGRNNAAITQSCSQYHGRVEHWSM
jgi:hypothetical protein